MDRENHHSTHSATRFPPALLKEKIQFLRQNSQFLEYKKGINQDSLNFILHRNRDEWNISDSNYMKLLNNYLAQRVVINNQLQINEKIITLLELETFYARLERAHNIILQFHSRCKTTIAALSSL